MTDRIKQIMDYEALGASKFAEAIGIKRSAVSHYLNGRNEPSVDVLKKIHETYPNVNLEWLLTGDGEMITEHVTKEIKQPTQLDLFASKPLQEEIIPPKNPVIQPRIQSAPENHREMRVEKPQNVVKQSVPEKIIIQKTESRQVNKIMLFYSDNTFETFTPEKIKKD